MRLTPPVPWSEQQLRRAREEEPRARKDAERAHRRGKLRQEMEALSRLGSALFNQGRYEEAMRVYEVRLELSATLGDAKAHIPHCAPWNSFASDKATWTGRSDSMSGAS